MRVLFIDNFDSFTYNLVDEFKKLGCVVKIYRNNIPMGELDKILSDFQPGLIVISPGPSHPKDAGICIDIIKKYYTAFPILGVCLGHQALIEAFGGYVTRAPVPVHGKKSLVYHTGSNIFHNIPAQFYAGRYHSLYGSVIPDFFTVTARTSDNIPMAVENAELKIYGLQFHPESILTAEGSIIISNILSEAGSR